MTDQTFGKNRRSILLLITAGLVLMLVSTLSYFSANPGLVSHTTTGTQAAAPSGQQMPTSAGMDEATQQGVMALMQKLQKNPTDLEALVGLTEHFMHTQDWQRAETFALRAVVAAPNETQPLYMLGIIQHSQNRNAEAAASLEKVYGLTYRTPTDAGLLLDGHRADAFLVQPDNLLANLEQRRRRLSSIHLYLIFHAA